MIIIALSIYFFLLLIPSSYCNWRRDVGIGRSGSPVQEFWSNVWSSIKARKEYASLQGHEIIPESDIRNTNRTIWIITTACLPWMTGTSINPLLRAAYLARNRPPGKVFLMFPWLPKEEQDLAYSSKVRFNSLDEQRAYVKNWLITEANMPDAAEKLTIIFYSGRYHDEFHSIFPMGDLTALIPDDLADVCVLEEPEHLNWFKAPFSAKAWMDKFKHVVGVIHTNYVMYSRSIAFGQLKGSLLYFINQGVCRAYCHKIIKLSSALQEFAAEKEVVCNVHGVRSKFLEVGDRSRIKGFSKGAYFIGKMAWPKGLKELFDLMAMMSKRSGSSFKIDLYGNGPHLKEIQDAAKFMNLPAVFYGPKDHSLLEEYRVFVNPSLSEVLCTTIVEALAMGKWVVCAKHPSNEFFQQFSNCLFFSNEEEFAANVFWALTHDPLPLTKEQRHTLTWEAATERFLSASMITKDMLMKSNTFNDKFLAWVFEKLGTGNHGDAIRTIVGAGAVANQIEFWNRFGSANPVVTEEDDVLGDMDKKELEESLREVLSAVQTHKANLGEQVEESFPHSADPPQ